MTDRGSGFTSQKGFIALGDILRMISNFLWLTKTPPLEEPLNIEDIKTKVSERLTENHLKDVPIFMVFVNPQLFVYDQYIRPLFAEESPNWTKPSDALKFLRRTEIILNAFYEVFKPGKDYKEFYQFLREEVAILKAMRKQIEKENPKKEFGILGESYSEENYREELREVIEDIKDLLLYITGLGYDYTNRLKKDKQLKEILIDPLDEIIKLISTQGAVLNLNPVVKSKITYLEEFLLQEKGGWEFVREDKKEQVAEFKIYCNLIGYLIKSLKGISGSSPLSLEDVKGDLLKILGSQKEYLTELKSTLPTFLGKNESLLFPLIDEQIEIISDAIKQMSDIISLDSLEKFINSFSPAFKRQRQAWIDISSAYYDEYNKRPYRDAEELSKRQSLWQNPTIISPIQDVIHFMDNQLALDELRTWLDKQRTGSSPLNVEEAKKQIWDAIDEFIGKSLSPKRNEFDSLIQENSYWKRDSRVEGMKKFFEEIKQAVQTYQGPISRAPLLKDLIMGETYFDYGALGNFIADLINIDHNWDFAIVKFDESLKSEQDKILRDIREIAADANGKIEEFYEKLRKIKQNIEKALSSSPAEPKRVSSSLDKLGGGISSSPLNSESDYPMTPNEAVEVLSRDQEDPYAGTKAMEILDNAKEVGGIDFRSMQMLIQPMGTFRNLNLSLPTLSISALERIDLDKELAALRNMVKAGMVPSGVRVKEYLAAVFQKGRMEEKQDELLLCLAEIYRLQEEEVLETSQSLRESLVIVDTGRFVLLPNNQKVGLN